MSKETELISNMREANAALIESEAKLTSQRDKLQERLREAMALVRDLDFGNPTPGVAEWLAGTQIILSQMGEGPGKSSIEGFGG